MVTVQRKRREGDLKGEPNTGASKLRAINSDLSQLVRESTTLNPKTLNPETYCKPGDGMST